jgi:hypothetical protein
MPNELDLMIKRLEEANARAHEKVARVDETVFKSEQDVAGHPSDQQNPPAIPDRRSPRGRPTFLALIGLLLAASACLAAFAWQSSYGDAAKLIVARWANALLPQPAPLASTTSQDVPAAAQMFPELAQRIQTMERDLANVAQGIEQLKNSQEQLTRDNATVTEQLKATLSQMTRDDAAVAEQFKAALSQITRDNAAIAEQLKASQEQTVRPRAPRMPVRILPQVRPLDAY